jgi:glycosyltransferase involved in cell wall biosynthesis
VTELSLRGTPRPRIFALISPLHCDTSVRTTHINKAYLDAVDRLLPCADTLFGIMGEYWWDQWPNSPYAHWMDKMVRLDMAIDTTCFPRVKRTFNPPGQRGFLYIGRNDPMKGTDFLSELACHASDYRWGWVGSGPDIDGIPRLSGARPMTPEFIANLAQDFDFFINTSLADPNPTTILESMAWGFPVICTPQSGYYGTSYRKCIDRDDIDGSVDVLRQLQSTDENRLQAMADKARNTVTRDYTWSLLVDRIATGLGVQGVPQKA